jgi:hypothetical protein
MYAWKIHSCQMCIHSFVTCYNKGTKYIAGDKLNPDSENITMLLITGHFANLYILVHKVLWS